VNSENHHLVIPKGTTIPALSPSSSPDGKMMNHDQDSLSSFWLDTHRDGSLPSMLTEFQENYQYEENKERPNVMTKSIPIPRRHRRSRHYESVEEENEEYAIARAKERYEMATWALYERVAAYREKNPVGQNYLQSPTTRENRPAIEDTSMESFSIPRSSLYEIPHRILHTEQPPAHQHTNEIEDEIFAMEL
jgi:hypothetical protein